MRSVARAWAFLSLLSLTLIVLGQQIAGREGLFIALTCALGINSFIYLYEDIRIQRLLGGKLLEGQDSYGIQDTVRRLSARVRIAPPKVYIMTIPTPQAAVVGRGISSGSILLTQGLLDRFSHSELEAVIAYQIASIKSLNTLVFSVGSFLTSVLHFVSGSFDALLRFLVFEKKSQHKTSSHVVTRILSPIFGLILKVSVRPGHYLYADKLAAELIANPKRLADVFWKLNSYSQTLPHPMPLSIAHIFIVSPISDSHWSKSYVAQPEASRRIKNLLGYFPV